MFLGYIAGYYETGSNKLYIANNATTPLIYGDFSSGKVGIGTTAPLAKLDVAGDIKISAASAESILGTGMQQGSNGESVLWYNTHLRIKTASVGTSGDRVSILNNGNVGIGTTDPGSYKLYVNGAAYSTGGWSGSDARWKKDVKSLEGALNNVLRLRGVSYFWKTEEFPQKGFTEEKQIGLIAQELEKVIPELVHTDNEGYKSVSYDKLTAILIEAVKEQQEQINALKDGKIASLENAITELKEAMNSAIMLTSVK